MITPGSLRCEYQNNPFGIDAKQPRLSWMLQSTERNQFQTAFQILAATSLEKLESAPDLWDSGRVQSSAILVPYNGRQLASGERCWWKVRVWDAQGQPGPNSDPAWFEMGLLNEEDWKANWIGFPGGWPGKAVYFRRDFKVEKPLCSARVYMAGLGWSELYVNGQRVNDRVLDPPQSLYGKRVLYSTDAVEEFLHPGKNTLGVICGCGWYGTPRLILQMNLVYQDGSTATVCSSGSWPDPWVVSTGPLQENSVYDGEVYDARLEDPNWAVPVGTGKGWITACFAEGPGGRLTAANLEPIRVVETLQPKSLQQPRPGIFVFDLGQNFAGWARLRASGPVGTQISLRYAESIYPDGTINQENLRGARAEDIYILKGEGEETWEPRFTYHGFRYIQMEGFSGEPALNQVEGRVVRSAVEPSGTFECSSELYNRIYQMVRWTEASNLHSLPTDCPQRDERMGWLNDMAARSEEAIYNFNLSRLFSKWMGDIADEQDPRSGAITDTAPFRWGNRPADPVSVCYLLVPWLLYVHYGDTRTLEERFSGMKAWVDYLTSRSQDGIVPYSYWGDWAPPIEFGLDGSLGSSAVSRETPGRLVSTACYAYSARLLSKIAAVLQQEKEAEFYASLAQRITGQYNAAFWDEAAGGYGSGNQSCNAISLYMDLVPAERRERVSTSLVAKVGAHQYHLTTGNICTKYLLEALTASGYVDAACAIASQETYPSWGYMLANGATTLWERWEKATGGGMNSHNHPMLGSVGAWLYRAVAGIQADPSGPGFERFAVCPNIAGGLTFARAALDTMRGTIQSAWQINDGKLHLDLTVPTGSRAAVKLPAPVNAVLQESGREIWRAGQPAADLADGMQVSRDGDSLVCSVGSGEYRFEIA